MRVMLVPARSYCPFRLNRDWLATPDERDKVLKILQRAEVYSGQVIVFREALALISFFLAGCPKDYVKTTPCGWVQDRFAAGDYFTLLSRRIFMDLFSSYSAHGLEDDADLRKKQQIALEDLSKLDEEGTRPETRALRCIVRRSPLSTDVGVTRLLGPSGWCCAARLLTQCA